MVRLNRNFYLIHNTEADIVTHYDDATRVAAWLLGKRLRHLVVYVVKGDRAKLLNPEPNVLAFQAKLIATMNSL